MAKEMQQTRAKIGVKRQQIHMKTVENDDVCTEGLISFDEDDTITQSGRINITSIRRGLQNQVDVRNSHLKNQVIDEQFEQTSKFSILLSNRNNYASNPRQNIENQIIDQENKMVSARGNSHQNNSYLEKTTPRSSRPNYYSQKPQEMHQPKSMISNYANVPKLPLNRKSNVGNKSKNSKKEQSIEITTSIDLSNINKKESNQSTNIKKKFIESSTKKVDESVYAPAFIIGEKDPEWDSFLDDTKLELNQEEINQFQKDYFEQLSQIKNQDQRILFKQVFALQHKIDPSILRSPTKINNCTTPTKSKLDYQTNQKYGSQNQQTVTKSTKKKHEGLTDQRHQNSDATHKIYQSFQSVQKSHKKFHYQDSSSKKYKFTDVKLQEVLDISNAIITQSPLPSLPTDEKQYPNKNRSHMKCNQDVLLEDIMNVRSLSISLRTATDAGAFQYEDQNNSFMQNGSDVKRSAFKFQYNTNQTNISHKEYHEDDSVINDLVQQNSLDQDRNHIRNMNKDVFNIIDENNNNGEMTGGNFILEESNSSYSKTTGTLNFQKTQQTLNSHYSLKLLGHNQCESINEYDSYKESSIEEDDKRNSSQKVEKIQIAPESFKSTAVMQAIGVDKKCLEHLQSSCNQSQIPTPAFSYKQKSSVNEYIDYQTDRSISYNDINQKKGGNYLMQNHSKLIEKLTEKCLQKNKNQYSNQDFTSQSSQNFHTIQHDQSAKDVSLIQNPVSSHSFIQNNKENQSNLTQISKSSIKTFIPRSNSANANIIVINSSNINNCKISKLKLNLKRASMNIQNSMIKPSQLQLQQSIKSQHQNFHSIQHHTNQSMITSQDNNKKLLNLKIPVKKLNKLSNISSQSVLAISTNGLQSVQNKKGSNYSSLIPTER
eukprot:403365802